MKPERSAVLADSDDHRDGFHVRRLIMELIGACARRAWLVIGIAIMLCAGDKGGRDGTTFYKALIREADDLFDQHLTDVEARRKTAKRARKDKKGRKP